MHLIYKTKILFSLKKYIDDIFCSSYFLLGGRLSAERKYFSSFVPKIIAINCWTNYFFSELAFSTIWTNWEPFQRKFLTSSKNYFLFVSIIIDQTTTVDHEKIVTLKKYRLFLIKYRAKTYFYRQNRRLLVYFDQYSA